MVTNCKHRPAGIYMKCTSASNLAFYMIFFLKILHCMLWIISQMHFKRGVCAEILFVLIQIPGFAANVKHGDIICDLCMNCDSTQTALHDTRQLFADVLCCRLSRLLSTLSVLPRRNKKKKKMLRDARFYQLEWI